MIGNLPADIDVETRVRADPATVFAYFTESSAYRRWMGDDVELDPRPGGRYRVGIPGRPVVEGEFLEVEPPTRVVFTWGWAGDPEVPPGSTTVEVTLTPDGDETIVRLVHRGLPSASSRAMHVDGWSHYLARLTIAASGADPGPDPVAGSSEEVGA
jgi:uncharacterized protein YndB with AHSA1/START domain